MFYYLLALFQAPTKYLQPIIQMLLGNRSLGDRKRYHFLTLFHNHHNSKVKIEQRLCQTNFFFSYCVCYVYIQLPLESISSKEKPIQYIRFFLSGVGQYDFKREEYANMSIFLMPISFSLLGRLTIKGFYFLKGHHFVSLSQKTIYIYIYIVFQDRETKQ